MHHRLTIPCENASDFTHRYFDVSHFELDAESALNELYLDYLQTGDYNKYLLNAQRVVDFKMDVLTSITSLKRTVDYIPL